MDIDELVENFEMLGPWDERYRYLIDLGRKLPPLPDTARTANQNMHGLQPLNGLSRPDE